MTLTRSILTNITTLSSIIMLYVLGVASIKEFTLPMIVGIVAGGLSSVFLTGPLWRWLRISFGKNAQTYRLEEKKALSEEAAASAEATPGTSLAEANPGRQGKNPNVIRKKKKKNVSGNHKM